MKRISAVSVVFLFLIVLSGCFEKSFESGVVLKGSKTLDFTAGETKTVRAELPSVEGVKLTAESTDSKLNVSLSDDNILTLSGETVGSYLLTLKLEADGYRAKQVEYPVNVTPRQMQVTFSAEDGSETDISERLVLGFDRQTTLVLSGVPSGAVYDIQSANAAVLGARLTQNDIELAAVSAGETTLSVEISCEGYEPFSAALVVEVEQPAAHFELSANKASGTTLDTLSVTCVSLTPGARLSAAADNPAVSVAVQGEIIRISSSKAGNFTVAVTCELEGHKTTAQTIEASFSLPRVPLPQPPSVTVSVGKVTEVRFAGLPTGTTLSFYGGNNNIAFENRGGILAIEGKITGSAGITVTASCPGYSDSSATLSVTVSGINYSASNTYSSYVKEIVSFVNKERKSRGLSSLVYLPELDGASQLRAKEASVLWEHERPDGRSWETVLHDMGYSYLAAGENLLDANFLDAEKAVESWMNSPGHRENILRPVFNAIGVGIYKGSDGDYYYAQLFITKE